MKNNTEVFLFGAGAVIDWGAPFTSDLTKLVRNSGFNIKNSEIKITEFIYQTLISNGYNANEINFETLINVIEELSVYYSEYNNKTKTPSLLRSFLTDNNVAQILNFSIKNGKRKHAYTIQIPEGKDYPFSKIAYNNENPNQFFLQHLLSLLITEINSKISKYSYHTSSYSVINTNSKESILFNKWMQYIEKENNLRIYTLNYDRIFSVLLQDINIQCFEGFDTDTKRIDIPEILKNNGNVHYNLHGSTFWKVKAHNRNGLPIPEILFKGAPNLPINYEQSNLQIEKGKPVFLTNIITGYQKAQKSMIAPFKQMQYIFDRDCIFSNKLTIVGYSFGDEHINESIKIALRYNNKLQIEIVSPNFINDKYDLKLALTLFQNIENISINPKKISDNIYSYFNDKIIVYAMKFIEYLELKNTT